MRLESAAVAHAGHEAESQLAASTKEGQGQEDLSHLAGAAFMGLGSGGPDEENKHLAGGVLQRHMSGQLRANVMRRAQQGSGNQSVQRYLARQGSAAVVQRQCACGTCSACRGSTGDEGITAQRQPAMGQSMAGATGSGLVPAASSGHPLDLKDREFMESRFGSDLSNVRIHTDAGAAESADALAADAYTVGRDIYFAAGKYSPASRDGQHLLAHELTHTVQQQDSAMPTSGSVQMRGVSVGSPDSPLEREADLAADYVVGDSATAPKISSDSHPTARRWSITGALGDAWDATGGRAVNYVEDKVDDAIEYTENWIESKVEKYAPGLLKLLRMGVADFLKEKITEGLDSIFGGVVSMMQKDGFAGGVVHTVEEQASGLGKAAAGMVSSACDSFAHAAGVVTHFAKSIAGPAFDGLKSIAGAVGGFFSNIWHKFIAPVWEAVSSFGGGVLTWIEEKARWIWEKTAPIRHALSRVWNWILRKFGVAWESGSSVLDWFKEKAKAAWDKVYEFTKPIHTPLKIIGGALFVLSGIGPIYAIWKSAPLLWDALTWLYGQWKNTDFIVLARKTLTDHVLPAIISGANTAASLLESAATWIGERIDDIDGAFGGLLKALGVSVLLSGIRRVVQSVADAFRRFATWMKTGFLKFLRELKEIILKIWSFLRPVLAFLLKLAIVVTNPVLLPIVITGYLWQALPNCFKPPIIDFVLDLLIAFVSALPTFKMLGEGWAAAKAKIVGALAEVRTGSTEQKIEASNRVARIMSGDDLAWLGNLLSAMLKVPDFLEGQFEEELLGMDLTEPLPFERAAMPMTGAMEAHAASSLALSTEDAAVLSKSHLSPSDIAVEQATDLGIEPELLEDLLAHGGAMEFRGPVDPSRSVAAIQDELNGAGGTGAAGPAGGVAAGREGPAVEPEQSTDEQLEVRMNQPAPETCGVEKPATTDTAAQIPESMKIGPLTRGQRAHYLLHQIGQGVKSWFKCNAYWLIPALIVAAAVLIALEVLTGGAVTAVLPEVMEVMGTIMIGVAAVRVAAYTAEYVGKAVSGDVAGAAKSLARGLAIAAIELVFALLFNLDKVIKTLKQGLKASVEAAAKAAKATIKGAVESVEEIGRIGSKGIRTAGKNIAGFGKAVVRNGKLLLEGVGEGFAKGIHKVQELFERLWQKLRFKGFRIRFSEGWFILEGEINPWVRIFEGKIKWLEKSEITEGGAKIGDEVVGKTAAGELIEGTLVGGSKLSPPYRKIAEYYIQEALVKMSVIHHAIEQQVLKRFPGLFTLEEIHGAENLRAILRGAFNSEVHLSRIRRLWDQFYPVLEGANLGIEKGRQALLAYRKYVDGYIEAMADFMKTDGRALAAESAKDKEALRALLAAESNRLLAGTGATAQKIVDSLK